MKDKLSVGYQFGVVYTHDCKNCDKLYMGQTKRDVKNRIYAYINFSKDKYKYKNKLTALADNHFRENDVFNFENVTS